MKYSEEEGGIVNREQTHEHDIAEERTKKNAYQHIQQRIQHSNIESLFHLSARQHWSMELKIDATNFGIFLSFFRSLSALLHRDMR